jgi:hypothetical protein
MQNFIWNGTSMVPTRPKAAYKEFVVGQRYWLEPVSERSWISHRHEFAFVKEAWMSLPEALADTFPTPEHLRKAALIATGWRRETLIDAGSAAAALRVAAYVRNRDQFAYVLTRGRMVIVREPRSQRMHGADRMDRREFQESKEAILGWISELLGVAAERLRGAA